MTIKKIISLLLAGGVISTLPPGSFLYQKQFGSNVTIAWDNDDPVDYFEYEVLEYSTNNILAQGKTSQKQVTVNLLGTPTIFFRAKSVKGTQQSSFSNSITHGEIDGNQRGWLIEWTLSQPTNIIIDKYQQ